MKERKGLLWSRDGRANPWKKPVVGWIKLNVDGAMLPSSAHGFAAGVFRDANGQWLVTECDSLQVVNMLLKKKNGIGTVALARRIQNLLATIDYIRIKHVYWESNLLADYLAKAARKIEPGLKEYPLLWMRFVSC
ncbi:hypothetical protein PVK06_034172 [Gossypium arboreum]|uniref:RNase H type-1 domain-containing protein n=1 Tax=Gossypium arboreum TaxID=29729 RepID=A0ABR0NEB7_GOSAR|nr:hypothetical protein PVK06_034172 [Gossypium arboreum]